MEAEAGRKEEEANIEPPKIELPHYAEIGIQVDPPPVNAGT